MASSTRRRVLAVIPLFLLTAVGGLTAIAVAGAEDPPATPTVTVVETTTRTVTVTVERRLDGHGIGYWHHRARVNYREARRLRHVLRHDGTVAEAINLACNIYGHCAELWRKAACESRLYPGAHNSRSGAAGLFQFLGSTWRTTPYGRFSVWSPYSNALAAGWMHAHGRGNEWSCR